MEIKTHTDITQSELDPWDALLEQSITNVPFLRRGYLERWWKYRGGGEWPQDTSLKIYSGWENGQLLALAPMFLSNQNNEEGYTLSLLGSEEISDYLDFIARPAHIQAFIHAWLTALNSKTEQSIRTISLVNIPQDSATLRELETDAANLGWSIEIQKAYHTPSIPLTDSWESYLAGIDKKQRHEMRRKMRRVAEDASSVSWYIVDQERNLDKETDAFFDLMAMDNQKEKFLSSAMRDQMHSILRWAFDEGFLQLSFLEIDGTKAAAYCCFDYNQRIYVYNSGFNMDFSAYSPGWVLLGFLIQHAIENRKNHFDFMRGDELYKYRLGGVDGFVMRTVLNRLSP